MNLTNSETNGHVAHCLIAHENPSFYSNPSNKITIVTTIASQLAALIYNKSVKNLKNMYQKSIK